MAAQSGFCCFPPISHKENILRHKSTAVFVLILIFAAMAGAQTETILWNFSNANGDGSAPWSNFLISDSKGNLYGVTNQGGTNSAGVIFELSPNGSGYTETILYEFKANGSGDGSAPYGSLVFNKGNLYGTTSGGGVSGAGTVYKLSPKSGGGWTEKVIYSFSTSGGDAQYPAAGVAVGKNGTLYGTTSSGGANGSGALYQLTKTTKGWTEKVIHSFGASGDGSFPYDGLMLDASGNLFGVTSGGGAVGVGTVYRLTLAKKTWTETVLYSFTNQNGDGSGMYYVNLVSDAAGNLYGTTAFGGTNGNGTVWELVYSKTKKTYSEKVLYSFGATGSGDGTYPYGGVIMSKPGTLYGTTEIGGSNPNGGTVYRLKKSGNKWKETILHNFTTGSDGQDPSANLLRDSRGNLFGMAQFGGSSNDGIVYRVKP
jgi:uncharacterized repeat protein (TIGR03803 family)